MTRFRSVHHPGTAPLAAVAARAQAGPVAGALVAVMVVTTAAVLQGNAVLGTLLWAAPLAYAAAAAWALYELHRKPAEVVLTDGMGAVRSVWDVARTRGWEEPPPLVPLFHPRKADGALVVGFGDAAVSFRPDEWPEFERLREALESFSDLQ